MMKIVYIEGDITNVKAAVKAISAAIGNHPQPPRKVRNLANVENLQVGCAGLPGKSALVKESTQKHLTDSE